MIALVVILGAAAITAGARTTDGGALHPLDDGSCTGLHQGRDSRRHRNGIPHHPPPVVVGGDCGILSMRGGGSSSSTPSAPAAIEAALTASGGGSHETATTTPLFINRFFPHITPQGRSVLCMAVAMSLHYLAYSYARPATIALFTSRTVGFGDSAAVAFPLAMAFISPVSLLLVLVYGGILERDGPRGALLKTTAGCSSVLLASAGLIEALQRSGGGGGGGPRIAGVPVIKMVTGSLFVFRESYVQLLTSQFWSFMVSVLTPSQSAAWFSRITGLTSILSAVAGISVSTVVDGVGIGGVLVLAGLGLLGSLVFSMRAFDISDQYGFNPADEHSRKMDAKRGRRRSRTREEGDDGENTGGMIQKASVVFAGSPTLGRLFWEILASQGLSTLLNVCFVAVLSKRVPDDGERAGWTGKFFALINTISCAIQFSIMPHVMRNVEPAYVWRAMPLLLLSLTCHNALREDPSLYLVSGTLLTMKVVEFSVRRILDEMIYVPLDFESRYVAKEVIGVFGYRFGKSGMSLALSGLTSLFGTLGLQELCRLTTGAALLWVACAFRLSNVVPTRAEADRAYEETHHGEKKRKSRNNNNNGRKVKGKQ